MLVEGNIVKHPTFGIGCVVHATFTRVWVYFPDLPGPAEAVVKKLDISAASLTQIRHWNDPRLAHMPVRVVNGVLEFPESTRLSHHEAVTYFLSKYPSGFKDQKLIDKETTYKREACELFDALFGGKRGRRLLERKKLDEIAAGINKVFHATNLPATQELMAVNDGLKDKAAAGGFLRGVLDFVDAPGPGTFGALVERVASLPAKAGKARVLTWPIVTLLPFFADPDRFILLKPTMTKKAAERLFFDLSYDSSPNWTTYDRAISFANSLRKLLKPHHAKDLLDIQTFIWETAGAPAMRARQGKE